MLRTPLLATSLAVLSTFATAQTTWQNVDPVPAAPAGSALFGLAFDAGRGVSVLRTGSVVGGTTWEYDGTGWSSLPQFGGPTAADFTLAYDAGRGVCVLHGGAVPGLTSASNETWEWNGATWTLVSTSGPARLGAAMAYDSSTGRLVLVGGADPVGNVFTDTWEFDGASATWSQVAVGGGPPVYTGMALDYDPQVGRVVLFGGRRPPLGGALSDETWLYRGVTQSWTRAFPATRPSPRTDLGGTYDPVRGGLLVHGGTDASGTLAETWTYEAQTTTWLNQSGTAGPARADALLAYDATRGRMVLFGGRGAQGSEKNETWELGGGVPANAYCFGDGSGTTCPCGNVGAAGAGCANSTGTGATLTSFGSTSVAATDLWFRATDLPANEPALLFAGQIAVNGGAGNLLGDGLRCAGIGVVRLAIRPADAGGTSLFGPGDVASGGFVPGETRHFQSWYRDPSGSPCGALTNLSNGVTVVFAP